MILDFPIKSLDPNINLPTNRDCIMARWPCQILIEAVWELWAFFNASWSLLVNSGWHIQFSGVWVMGILNCRLLLVFRVLYETQLIRVTTFVWKSFLDRHDHVVSIRAWHLFHCFLRITFSYLRRFVMTFRASHVTQMLRNFTLTIKHLLGSHSRVVNFNRCPFFRCLLIKVDFTWLAFRFIFRRH